MNATMKKLLVGVVFFAIVAQARPQLLSKLFGSGNSCDDAVPSTCAVLFGDNGCGGWKTNINEGHQDLQASYNDDAKALTVRPGCVLTAYDGRGSSGSRVIFDARGRKLASGPLVVEDLTDGELKDKISSTGCFCAVRNVTSRSKIEGSNILDSLLNRNSVAACNAHVNRTFNDRNACAVLFDEDGCDGELEEVPEGVSSLSRLRRDVESVMVRPGCVLVGRDGSGGSVVLDSSSNNREPLVKNLKGSKNLEETIASVECRCSDFRSLLSLSPSSAGLSGRCSQAFGARVTADCIVYDGEDCRTDRWSQPGKLSNRQNARLNLESGRKSLQDIESVSVRRGCKLEIFEGSSFNDEKYAFEARSNNLHVTLSKHPNVRYFDDIKSMKCMC